MTAPFEILTLPAMRPELAPPCSHVMAKPTGAISSLDCKYCLFLSKADDIMFLYDAEEVVGFAKVGRKEQCPCGSRRKYKRCHGRKERNQAKTF